MCARIGLSLPFSRRKPKLLARFDVRRADIRARALQLAERIELKDLERPDQFPAIRSRSTRQVAALSSCFRFGTAVFINMNPLEEEGSMA